MIRHSSSFIISLILHLLILLAIFFIYKLIPKKEGQEEEKKIRIDLCSVSVKAVPKATPLVQKIKAKPKIVAKKKIPVLQAPPIKQITKVQEFKEVELVKKREKILAKKLPEVIQEKKEVPEIIQEKEEVLQTKPREKNVEQEYISEHLKKISQLLSENLYYPRSARKRNIQGAVIVKFKLSTSAKVSKIEIVSSKSEILSRAAIKTIENLSGSFPHPPQELLLHVPITYKLSK